MIEYIFISYAAMLIRFTYIMAFKDTKSMPSDINVKVGVFVGFVLIVGFAPLTFAAFIIKSIFK